MMRSTVCVWAMLLAIEARPAEPDAVRVLDGPEVQPMRDGLARLKCPFGDLKTLDQASLAGCRVLVVCGTQPPVDKAAKQTIARFVEAGGGVLAVGGGAKCLVDLGLFDAEGYYMAGTTLHNTVFDGYHRLTFGYPGADGRGQGTNAGIGYFLRATNGPFMKLGPKAASILAAGGGYSLAAVQRLGQGRLMLLGADPQGGQLFSDVNKPSHMPGNQLNTDQVLANAVAFLLAPHCNLIPNSGFETMTDLAPTHSHWEVISRAGARHEWCKTGAAEGQVCLKLVCPGVKAGAEARPLRPIVVECGQPYTFACQYRSTAAWKLSWLWLKRPEGDGKAEAGPAATVPASAEWTRFETKIPMPADVPYARPILRLADKGELLLNDVTLRLD